MNAHIILEEYRAPPKPQAVQPDATLFVFSAMTAERLRDLLTRFYAYLETHPDLSLADVAWTLQVGKNELPCRLALLAAERPQLLAQLGRFLAGTAGDSSVFYTPSILDCDPRVEAAQLEQALSQRQLAQLGVWWSEGVSVSWDALYPQGRPQRVSLPAYPFEQVRCWYQQYLDAPSVVHPLGASLKLHPFVGSNQSDLNGLRYRTPIYLNELLDYVYTQARQPRVLPTVVAEIMAAVAHLAGCAKGFALTDVQVGHDVDWSRVSELSASLSGSDGALQIELAAREAVGESRAFARGQVRSAVAETAEGYALDGLKAAAVERLDDEQLYRQLAGAQLVFTPYLEVVETAWRLGQGGVLCSLRATHPEQDRFKRNLQLPPRLLGAAWQALLLVWPAATQLGLARISRVQLGAGEASHVLLRPGVAPAEWDVLFLDDAGQVVAALVGLGMARAEQMFLAAPAVAVRAATVVVPQLTVMPEQAPMGATSDEGARAEFNLGLRELVARMLKFRVEDINPRSPFYDLGFDSISLTRLADEINAEYGASLTPAIFFECEHIAALAGWLAARLPRARLETAAPTRAESPASPSPLPRPQGGAVAVVGLATRLPGCDDAAAFFEHLLQGCDLVGDLPLARYSPAYRARMERGGFPLRGGFLADIDRFDAAFFKTSPHEASRMDPQQRLLLETVWRTLENSGYAADELPRQTGVFVGVSGRDYASLLQVYGVENDGYAATGNSLAMVANRVSWQLDLHGPSEAVDTACSSSLVALLRAADAIRSGQCRMALVGGVNLAVAIEGFEGPWQAGMLSPTGRCKTFSSEADGYVRGEGVVVLLLKGLAEAERDGDRILGLLAGGAVNHGGHAGSLTAPNAKAQAELVRQAMAGIAPESIGYIEAHGTGTNLGDPVEINGLRLAYADLEKGNSVPHIGLGSVKSNIGHLEAAAGLAGVAKVLLAMEAGELPPSLHCANINPYIELQGSPFYLVRARQSWPVPQDASARPLPRRAGVSSFGFGGSNAHVVLEEYANQGQRRQPKPQRVFADTRFWLPMEAAPVVPRADETVLLVPAWREVALPSAAVATSLRRLVLSCEFDLGPHAASMAELIPVAPLAGDVGERYRSLAAVLLQTLAREFQSGLDGDLLLQLLVPLDAQRGPYAGLGALLDSARAENPRLLGQVVEISPALSAADALACLDGEARYPRDKRVRYQDGVRRVRVWEDLPAPRVVTSGWRPGGVYLISGGAGALGQVVAEDIARQAPGATLVLVGASPLDVARQQAIARLQGQGAMVHFRQLDISDAPAVAALVQDCQTQYGGLHGVIHCAGIHRDSAVIRKTQAELGAVLAPKVAGVLALQQACGGLQLDCFVLFSSLAAAVGNAGQADYAAANGFLDAFAEWRGSPMTAIDWPLWRDGGMRVSAAGEQAFFDLMGQRPLSTQAGLAALHACLQAGRSEVAVIAGDGGRIREFFRQAASQALATDAPTSDGEQDVALRERVGQSLGGLLARIAGLSAAQILLDEPLENHGIDSLMINKLNRELGENFASLSKTLFFEYRTLSQVAGHLVRRHEAACRRWVGLPAALVNETLGQTLPKPAVVALAPLGDREPIAIIGISGRYPGAADLDEFWANLASGRESIGEVPAERWSLEGFYESDPDRAVAQGMSYSRWGGFLDGWADFDPLFFRISPREAATMDPQERLFLMQAWAACEDAGYTRARLGQQHRARVGVFVGVTKTGFAHHGVWQSENGAQVRPTTSFASIANRVSFCMDIKGPSMPIDTMCSSSLTAIHEACEHIQRGECEMALAGGVNLYLHPDNYVELCAARMLSPDGHCRSFGAGANGFVPGEGVGCLLLKPLSRALADGDRVHGLIRGSAVNHAGKTSGYTVPSPVAQGEVVRAALARAGLNAQDIGYVEAHGTGTELGDPIELSGLQQAFGGDGAAGHCALGSVKSAIGHLEAAAGIAGVTKVLLQMRHRQLVPTLHAERINPNLEFEDTPFHLQRQLAAWQAPENGRRPRLAGVSSFGAGGANAHVIVEEWPTPSFPLSAQAFDAVTGASTEAILLSARDPERLCEAARRLLAFLTPKASPFAARSSLDPDIGRVLAEILGVDEAELDPDESLQSYGLEPAQRHVLHRALEDCFELPLERVEFASWDSISAIARALAPRLPGHAAEIGEQGEVPDLTDVAWTLQVGREPMDQRLAIAASTTAELVACLRAWLQAPPGEAVPGVQCGAVGAQRATLGLLAGEPDLQEMVGRWLARGDVARVLGLWVQGLEIDWLHVPRRRQARIVSVPTYPFARERYWLPETSGARADAVERELAREAQGLAPLLAQHEELENQLARVLRAELSAIPTVAASWDAWRAVLNGLLQGHAEEPAGDVAEARAAWDAYRQRAASGAAPLAQIRLAETVRAVLPGILSGALAPTAVLFPDGRMELVEAVYKENAVASRFNQFLAGAAAAQVERTLAAAPGTRLRILEIGAGTGGTSAAVFEALAPRMDAIAEYRYSDVSRAFLIHGERHFRDRVPGLRTALFDVEKPLAGQDVEPGAYDLVIAANVLHATRDVSRTMGTVLDLLAPSGVLLVNETSCATLFTHLTFGLLEGWWRFTDPELRIPGSPALTPASWRHLLEGLGFEWIGATRREEEALGQQVWAARRAAGAVKVGPLRVSVPESTDAAPTVTATAAEGGGLRALIVEVLAATLNLTPAAIKVSLPFADYGLDSILGAELVHRLGQRLGVRVAQTELFDYPSVLQLETHLARMPLPGLAASTVAAPRQMALAESAPAISVMPAHKDAQPPTAWEPIAIVGYSGRFADSDDAEALWRHLLKGDDLVRSVSRFDLRQFYQDAAPESWCNYGSFIDGIEQFDARFFNISGLEATYMDPQQRLFLQEAWRTLEHAGHAGAEIEGRRCGVFAGCAHGDYQELFHSQPPGQAFWGNTCSLIPARIAYHLNLKGPAISVDTACSSSLVAVHMACHSLWQGESEMALAGGVFVQSSPRFYRYANEARMLSPSGRCAAFGAGADGIVPGEAVGTLLLRPLSQALADGDAIHGLIVASGINQDGATNGITAPSALSQEQLIREVYKKYGIDPERIALVEAHGTGTPLGDPIEHAALTRAYSAWTDKPGYCALGSIKSNIGHATTAAGAAGLIKVLLALEHRQIPPTLHAEAPNPELSLTKSPFYLNSTPVAWPVVPGLPRQAAISSFGFGGTNAHLVLEEGPATASRAAARPAWLFPLSARSAAQLRVQAERLLAHLSTVPGQACGDIAYTLSVGRRHFAHRLVLLAGDRAELQAALSGWLAGEGAASAGNLADSPAPEPAIDTEAVRVRLAQALETGPAAYRAALTELGESFLAGRDGAAASQFAPGQGSRLPLPTYPFAGKRYWVGPEAVAVAVKAEPAATVVDVPRPAGRVRHRLADPLTCCLSASVQRAQKRVKVALSPLTATPQLAAALLRLADRDGLRSLQIVGPWDARLLSDLGRELWDAGEDQALRAVLIVGDWWAPEGFVTAPGAVESPLDCPLPVIAAVPAARGAGLDMAAHCDFMVLAEEGVYAGVPGALLERRFGRENARRLGVAAMRGQNLAVGMPVVAADQVEAQALALAQQIIAVPRLALVELKRHMRLGAQAPVDLPGPALGAPELAGPVPAPTEARGRRLPLSSQVMELELFDDGVALLRMLEREYKNTFTPAFMAGMEEAFGLLARTPACKVLVLTGYDGYFACGGTREGMESLQRGESRFTDQRIYSLPLSFELPVIAAMQGHAIGAGWSLGMFCDQALFSADSVYHSNYLWYGFTPGAGATLVFPHRLGDDLGREVLFSAREFKGRELAERGVSVPAYPAAEVLPRALALAHSLARGERGQLRAQKASATVALRTHLEAVFARELAMHEKTFIGNPLVMARIASAFAQTPASPAQPPPRPGPGRRANIRQVLVATLAEELLLEPDEIDDSASFLALGLDSILAVTWLRKLNERLGIALPATCIYAHPNLGALLTEVLAQLPEVEWVPEIVAAVVPTPRMEVVVDRSAERARLRKLMVSTLAEELLLDAAEIGDTAGFLELGLDSILVVTWLRTLNALLGISLPATCVYAHPTVGALLAEVVRLQPSPATAPVEVTQAPAASIDPPAETLPPSVSLDTPRVPAAAAKADGAIAIIGSSGRFPMAADLEVFWENICNGRDCIGEIPPSRWDLNEYYDSDPQAPGKSYSKWMGAIDDIDLFDASFFNITAREAELMDPQQRLFLQHAWLAIEDAAIDPASLAGARCGVFAGSGNSGYGELISETNAYSLIGSAGSILAARIAYLLDLRGPCIALDTACSTSLVAIAEACNSLVMGNGDLALAGGACVMLGPKMHVDTCKVGMLSPDGHCYSFDHRANGFVPGEGVGVVLLKRLADAERDGDPIRAVIRGWGMNQDGRTNGITAPNPQAQGDLLREVYRRFDIDPASIGLVEAHGTGTPLGDPIEIEGLRAGFGPVTSEVALGSVKSNVGHLLAAAGVAGAIKAMLALEHAQLPPSILFERQNEHLALAGSPFHVQTKLAPWPASQRTPRRAAVSAFGFSGTNAHLVLEAYPQSQSAPSTARAALCVLSARSQAQLPAQAATLLSYLQQVPGGELNLHDFCWTLQTGRKAFESRVAFVFSGRDELFARLNAVASGSQQEGLHRGSRDGKAMDRFDTDGEGQELLQKWLATGRLDRLAELWVQGVSIDWKQLPEVASRRRLRLPGYVFARERHWLKDSAPAAHREAVHPLFAGNVGIHAGRFRGDEAYLSYYPEAGERVLLGLFYPEMARAAGELASGRQVQGMRHVVWGRPLRINGAARDLAVQLQPGERSWRYRICADEDAGRACQVGELSLAGTDGPVWPALPVIANGEGCSRDFRLARPAARGIEAVVRDGDLLRARWSRPPGEAAMRIDPVLLDAIWQLVAFHDQQQGLPGPRFPLALESLSYDEVMPDQGWIWLWHPLVEQPALTVQVVDLEGRPCLCMEGLFSEQLGAFSELLIEPEMNL